MEDKIFLKSTLETIEEGIIGIDCRGKIVLYNRKAKEIFGIIYNQGVGHEGGKVEEGDIVVIADNCLGKDDGKLEEKDFKLIGIDEKDLKKGDAVVAIGVVGSKAGEGFCTFSKIAKKTLILKKHIKGYKISAEINFENKVINIEINGECFSCEYINALGHMAVIDGQKGKVKFYQAKGYTVRREHVKNVLYGKTFSAKGDNTKILDVIGKNIFEAHPKETNIIEFLEAAQGKNICYENKIKEINGRPTRCSLIQVIENKEVKGALLKVEDITELKHAIEARDFAIASLNEVESKWMQEKERKDCFSKIIGESESVKIVIKLAQKAASSESNILILGESGTGKGLLAEEIHKASKRKKGPYIYVNCAAIPESLLESQLFGYESGSFTGAKKEGKKGFFEAADGGTIFLDEIGEVPLQLQAKLLEVLQSKSFCRVGGIKSIAVNVKIVTATNKDLEEEVEKGDFRKDLYYRINIFPIYIPALRTKKEDIYLLVHKILPMLSKRIGCEEKRISQEAMKFLMEYDWPGNIRELENVLERAVNIMDGDIIFKEHIHIKINKKAENTRGSELYSVENYILPLKVALQEAERKSIETALKITKGNKKEAMEKLGIGKTCFYEKIKEFNLK